MLGAQVFLSQSHWYQQVEEFLSPVPKPLRQGGISKQLNCQESIKLVLLDSCTQKIIRRMKTHLLNIKMSTKGDMLKEHYGVVHITWNQWVETKRSVMHLISVTKEWTLLVFFSENHASSWLKSQQEGTLYFCAQRAFFKFHLC